MSYNLLEDQSKALYNWLKKKSGCAYEVEVSQVWPFASYEERVWGLVSPLSFLFTIELRVSFH